MNYSKNILFILILLTSSFVFLNPNISTYDGAIEVAFLPISGLFVLGILFLPILQSLRRIRDKI